MPVNFRFLLLISRILKQFAPNVRSSNTMGLYKAPLSTRGQRWLWHLRRRGWLWSYFIERTFMLDYDGAVGNGAK